MYNQLITEERDGLPHIVVLLTFYTWQHVFLVDNFDNGQIYYINELCQPIRNTNWNTNLFSNEYIWGNIYVE